MAAKKVVRTRKKKVKKNIEKGQAHIRSSFNNTIVTLSDVAGNVLHGPVPENSGSKAPEKAHPSLLRLLRRKLQNGQWNTV